VWLSGFAREPTIVVVNGGKWCGNVRKKGVLARGQNTMKVWITELNGA